MNGFEPKEAYDLYANRIMKKDSPTVALQLGTLGTASAVIDKVKDIPFSELTLSLYILCDNPMLEKKLALKYQSVLEMAAKKPETVMASLHNFYMEQARYIKKQYLYQDFFDFMALFINNGVLLQEMRESEPLKISFESGVPETVNEDTLPNKLKIFSAYSDLLMQQIAYLKPQITDEKTAICGLATNGTTLLTLEDPLGDVVVPAIRATRNGTSILDEYRKLGYPVQSTQDIAAISLLERSYENGLMTMIPYINEYTRDIVAEKPYMNTKFPLKEAALEEPPQETPEGAHASLQYLCTHRKRSLPPNGTVVSFESSSLLDRILLREVFQDDQVVLLFKVETKFGDLNGFYRTKTGFIHTYFDMIVGADEMRQRMIKLAMWAYASVVSNESLPYLRFFADNEDVKVFISHRPGKLHKAGDGTTGASAARAGMPGYEEAVASINGFVRKLPAGQKASEKARALAEDLGYDLDEGETYVMPHTRTSWVKRRPEDRP